MILSNRFCFLKVEYMTLNTSATYAGRYGMTAIVSMHHDVCSRYCGGSGMPAWTLEVVGFDLHAIEDAGAAWLLGQRGGANVESEKSA